MSEITNKLTIEFSDDENEPPMIRFETTQEVSNDTPIPLKLLKRAYYWAKANTVKPPVKVKRKKGE